TSVRQVGGETSPYSIFNRQLLWASIGFVGMLLALKVPYQRWRSLVIPGTILAAGAMMLPFVPGLGATINDANSWVRFGSFGFQPSEFLKLAAIAFLADLFTRHRDELHLPGRGAIPLAVVAFGCAGISFVQGDLGSAIVLATVVLSVGMIAGVPLLHVSSIGLLGAMGATIAIISDPRRFNRLTAFRDIEGNKEHLAWQSWQGLLSIANGGMTGSGIGGSNSKLGYLPLAHSDFIFAVVADELGFIGSFAVVGGFALLVWFGIQTALAAPDQFGLILAGGIAAWFGLQAIVNLGGVVGLMPVTGLTLPFFSAGGTSLFTSMVAAGLLLNVARRAVTSPRRPVASATGRRSAASMAR
ncbi:MAG: cell division protein FtsW, partial [Ilumatobacter sp.]|nr:cell division protein FtsW [Ilumatobacter sp.]